MASDTTRLESLRRDFPALARTRRGKPPIYFNNTCMTLRPQAVIDALVRYYSEFPTCGGGRAGRNRKVHNWFLEELAEHEHEARGAVQGLLGARLRDEIVWTRNTSEALNIVAHGLDLQPGDEVLGTEREHNSNLVPWLEVERRLREQSGDPSLVVRRHVDLAKDGSFDRAAMLAAITERTKVVALGHASNLDGTVLSDDDVRAVAARIHEVGGVLVLDAAQSVPHRAVDVQALDVDFLACSFHKMCGPTMGALYGRTERLNALRPFIVGGDTVADTWQDRVIYKEAPERFEAGLQNYAGMLGVTAAIKYVTDTVGLDAIREQEHRLNAYLSERLQPLTCDHFWLLGPEDASERGGVCTMTSGSGAIINAIERLADEEHNIMLRKGMFCVNAYLHKRWDAYGSSKNNLRASVYFYNTIEECERLCDIVERVVRSPFDYFDDE